ncbi:dual oxidase maturation factor 1-like [Atheta coriaria]|uniref:dual oxidase maturation factor 1-like n=1 Tax=Dalotia coriaria TaxID=877792 RepID=UPI0031F3F508
MVEEQEESSSRRKKRKFLVGNFGQEWEVAHIHSKTAYKAGTNAEIDADIGVKIGLRSVNITLKSDVDSTWGALKGEVINYNERFEWTWEQGRFGFGPYAGHFQQEFRAAQYRGVPTPILWIADYFVIDGEGQRFGRFYRTAGWYAHISMWSAFPCWIIANILSRTVLRYCGYSLGLCGFFQLMANLLWVLIKNPNPLVIPFEDDTLVTKYGGSFWLTFVSGIICITLCIVIVIADNQWTYQLHNFFGLSALNSTDEKYLTYDEVQKYDDHKKQKTNGPEDLEMLVRMRPNIADRHNKRESVVVRVRRNTNSVLRPPVPPKRKPARAAPPRQYKNR